MLHDIMKWDMAILLKLGIQHFWKPTACMIINPYTLKREYLAAILFGKYATFLFGDD